MARNRGAQSTPNDETESADGAPPMMTGGASGVVQSGRATSGAIVSRAPTRTGDAVVAPARRYRVMRGGRVMLHGGLTIIREGKIIDETQYPVDLLRDQAIHLEEIVPPAPPPARVEEATDE